MSPCAQRIFAPGYTLLEFLLTLTVIAILTVMSVGAMQRLRARIDMNTNINNLIHAIHDARSRALISGDEVLICPTRDGFRCDAQAPWESGWLAFRTDSPGATQPAADARVSAAEPMRRLRVQANRQMFVLRPFGRRSTNGTLVFCNPQALTGARAIIISYTGKPRVSERDSAGRPLTCRDV